MTDRDSLYRAVLDNPDDDTLRLVYADAIEESGDARRAAFVRTRVELSHVPEYDPFAIRARYHDRKKQAEGVRWIGELPPLPDGISWARDPFRRGLPGAIQARDGAAFVAHADDLFALYPIESLELKATRVADTAAFTACHWLTRVRYLSLLEGAGGPTVQRLLDSDHFERLTALHLGPQMTTAPTVRAAVRSRVFKHLTDLSVHEDRRGGGSLAGELARLTTPPQLKRLDLASNRLTAESLGPLVASAALETVEELDLSDNHLGAAGLTALAGAALPNLRVLHLLRTGPTVEGIAALVAADFLPALRSLSLGVNGLVPTATTPLAGASAANLRVLNLHDNRFGDRGAESIAKSANLAGLLTLDVAESYVGTAGADALSRSEHLTGRMYLNVYGNAFDAPAAGRLR